jgi:hypothetical protein
VEQYDGGAGAFDAVMERCHLVIVRRARSLRTWFSMSALTAVAVPR